MKKSILCYVHQWQICKMWRFLLNTKWSSCENTCTLRWHVYERDRQNYCWQCRKPILGKYMAKPQIPIIEKTSQNSTKHWPYYYLIYFICQNLWTIKIPKFVNVPKFGHNLLQKAWRAIHTCCKMVAFHICKMANSTRCKYRVSNYFFLFLLKSHKVWNMCKKLSDSDIIWNISSS